MMALEPAGLESEKSFLETTMRRGFVGDGDDAMTHL